MEAVDGFAQETAGDLITILENLDLPDAEEAFSRARLFLPHRLLVELGLSLAHALREDDLEAMLRYIKDLRRAIPLYLEEHVDLDAMIDQCAEYSGFSIDNQVRISSDDHKTRIALAQYEWS